MQSKFAANSVPLGRLLNTPFLIRTPDYQRPYAWEEDEAGRVFDDVSAAAEGDGPADDGDAAREYFLGTILLVDRDETAPRAEGWPFDGPARTFEVVDGLQRLTTLCVLFCALRDIAAQNGEPADPRLLRAITSTGRSDGTPWLSLRASDEPFFQAQVRGSAPDLAADGLPLPQRRIAATRKMFLGALAQMDAAQRARLTGFLLDNVYIVLIATTGIDRAHRMFMVLNERGKPLARSDILKADVLGRAGDAAPRVAAAWEAMEELLGEDFESLFSHVRAMYGRPNGPVISNLRALVRQSGGTERFVMDVLMPAAQALDAIRKARAEHHPQAPEIAQTLRYLNWLPTSDWIPPLMLYWQAGAPDRLRAFVEAIDRMAYGFKFLGLGASRRGVRYGAVCAAIRAGQDVLAPGGVLALTGQEEKSVRYNLQNLHERAPLIAKLVLLRVNDRIAGRQQNLKAADWTVEHVLPRNHAATSQWRKWFQDPAERGSCMEALGNLLLVTKSQNDRAANRDLAHKLAVYFESDATSLPVNEALRGRTQWRPADVKARTADLYAHLDAIWSFGLGT